MLTYNKDAVLGDFFVAGHETTVTTLSWAILYMIHNPEIQERCYRDLENFGRLPGYEDRNSLLYIQAVLLEIQRCGNIAPISLLHATLENTELFKYKIPKGATVILNLTALLRNPEYFPEPEKFNPDRFLEANGTLKTNEAMIPFSIGKRACAGESLAKMELFMMFSALIFTYKISSGAAGLPPLEPHFGFTLSPKPFLVKLEKRQK